MGEKEMRNLKIFSEKCDKLSAAKVYESDREVAESFRKIPVRTVGVKRNNTCVFAVKKA